MVCPVCGGEFRGHRRAKYCSSRCSRLAENAKTSGYDAVEAYRVIVAGGGCRICGTSDNLVVDHDHKTGLVRGLLCRLHNKALGAFGDDDSLLFSAGLYLARHEFDLRDLCVAA